MGYLRGIRVAKLFRIRSGAHACARAGPTPVSREVASSARHGPLRRRPVRSGSVPRPFRGRARLSRRQTVAQGLATGLHGPLRRGRVLRVVGSERAKVGLAVDAESREDLRR